MNIEHRLRDLEARYRAALSNSAASKAHYLALLRARGASRVDIERAKARWKNCESRRRSIAARMGESEALEDDVLA